MEELSTGSRIWLPGPVEIVFEAKSSTCAARSTAVTERMMPFWLTMLPYMPTRPISAARYPPARFEAVDPCGEVLILTTRVVRVSPPGYVAMAVPMPPGESSSRVRPCHEPDLAHGRDDGPAVLHLGADQKDGAQVVRLDGPGIRDHSGGLRRVIELVLLAGGDGVYGSLARVECQGAVFDPVVDVQVEGGGYEAVDVYLGAWPEEDAVLVDEVHLPVRLEGSVNLARTGVPYAVEDGPCGIALLIEIDRRVRAYIEALPVDDCLRLGLVDGHLAARGDRSGSAVDHAARLEDGQLGRGYRAEGRSDGPVVPGDGRPRVEQGGDNYKNGSNDSHGAAHSFRQNCTPALKCNCSWYFGVWLVATRGTPRSSS